VCQSKSWRTVKQKWRPKATPLAQLVDTMDSINESAKKIVDIISVIDGIA
jgi:methyl-accepting chemotaxis protein